MEIGDRISWRYGCAGCHGWEGGEFAIIVEVLPNDKYLVRIGDILSEWIEGSTMVIDEIEIIKKVTLEEWNKIRDGRK